VRQLQATTADMPDYFAERAAEIRPESLLAARKAMTSQGGGIQ
jgi:hypothetical protein